MFSGFAETGNHEEDERLFLDALSLMMVEENGSFYKRIANLSNIAASIYDFMDNLNWAGFYLYDGENLVLGPFQGEPACSEIMIGRGVCGTAASEMKTQIVEDVHEFPGHIACSSASESELVVPVVINDCLYGVIDLDSPEKGRFSIHDALFIEKIASLVSSLS